MGCGTCAAACPVRAITHAVRQAAGSSATSASSAAPATTSARARWYSFDVVNNYEAIMETIDAAMAP